MGKSELRLKYYSILTTDTLQIEKCIYEINSITNLKKKKKIKH